MNWLDIILIVINILLIIGGIITIILAIVNRKDFLNEWKGIAIMYWLTYISLIPLLLIILPFFVMDKSSGSTIGMITSVDKNFFGTTAIYIKSK